MKARPILRFLFAPEIFRLGRDLAASVGRFRGLVAGLLKRPEPGSFSWKRLTAPHNRLLTLLGSLLVAGAMFPIAIGAGGLLSAAARAQTMEPGLFDEEDRGTRDLLSFFGELDLEPHGVLGDMLYLFNGGILALAGFLLIYHIVSGTVATARTGRSGFGGWQILRIVTAIALMAPLPGGMSGGQHIVVGLANLGGDFANTIWRSFSEASLVRGQPVAPGPASANWRSAIARTLLAAVCRHVANAEAVAAGDAAYIAVRTETGPGRVILHFDGRGGMPGDLCGSIRFDGLDGEGPGALAAAGHRDALEGLFPVIGELAARFGDHYVPGSQVYGQPLPDVDTILREGDLAGTYASVLGQALRDAATAETRAMEDRLAEDAARSSWLSAAGFFNTIAARTGRFRAAVQNVPDVSLPLPSLEDWLPRSAAAVRALVAALAHSRHYQPVFFSAAAGVTGSLPTAAGGASGLVDSLLEFIDLDTIIVADSGNPVADLSGMGHNLISASVASIMAISGAAAGSGFLESIPFIGRGLDAFESVWRVTDSFVSTILGLFLLVGVILAYVLPSLPFIRFLFGIFAWLLNVVEAVMAIPVFAAAHVTREDPDRLTVPATRQGWLFLPGLVLRPPLMLFGLILGHTVFVAAMGLFNEIWLPRLREVNGSTSLGVIDALAMLSIYVVVTYVLMNSAFKLIDGLPDAVLQWIGAQSGSGDDDSRSVSAVLSAGTARVSGMRLVGQIRSQNGPRS